MLSKSQQKFIQNKLNNTKVKKVNILNNITRGRPILNFKRVGFSPFVYTPFVYTPFEGESVTPPDEEDIKYIGDFESSTISDVSPYLINFSDFRYTEDFESSTISDVSPYLINFINFRYTEDFETSVIADVSSQLIDLINFIYTEDFETSSINDITLINFN